ncbi:MFS transporter [Bacillus sp. AFS076308]|uniref:MFS transporter n=1 Tax=unclassified Bacillus (in: firmicutes) TaxID=185979 RepID=UPI000BF653F4|nr:MULTISPECIES: MFS transporter [unclassified Bacillus (in: firmicutes)]PFO09340.1 MFS transporter [Bacillus sp. AFS076308]PGV50318.1 MFS transporter [Bacillus sp. AFS037270]
MTVITDFKLFLKIKGAWILLIGMFFYGTGTGILAPMNAVYMRDGIGLSKIEIVSIFSISLLLNMVTTMVVGIISDKIKRKKRLPIFACIVCMAGLLIYMNASTYMVTLIGMVFAVAPSGLIMGQFFAMARNHFMTLAPEIHEMAQIWLRATLSVGFFTGLLVGANLYIIGDFKSVLWGNFLGYAALFVVLIIYKEYEAQSSISNIKGEPFSLVMLFALLLLACADALRGLYLPLVVVQLFKAPQIMSYLWSVQAVFELLFMTVAGYWANKFGSKLVIMIGSICALTTYLLYSVQPPIWVFFLVQPLYSFFVSVLYGVAMGYVQRMFHTRIGFGSSLYVFLSQTASLIGYFLPFFITGYQPRIFIIPCGLVSASIILMVGLVFIHRVKAKKDSDSVGITG